MILLPLTLIFTHSVKPRPTLLTGKVYLYLDLKLWALPIMLSLMPDWSILEAEQDETLINSHWLPHTHKGILNIRGICQYWHVPMGAPGTLRPPRFNWTQETLQLALFFLIAHWESFWGLPLAGRTASSGPWTPQDKSFWAQTLEEPRMQGVLTCGRSVQGSQQSH